MICFYMSLKIDPIRINEWTHLRYVDKRRMKDFQWKQDPRKFEFLRMRTIIRAGYSNNQPENNCLIIGASKPRRSVNHKRMWFKDVVFLTEKDLYVLHPKHSKSFQGYPPEACRFVK